jgi:hypothetical protein
MPDRSYWQKLVDDYTEAFKRLGLTPTKHALLLAATPGEFETNSGRAWPGTYNVGAVQGRALTQEEQAKLASGELRPGARIAGDPGYVLQYDTNPDKGGAKYPVWFVAFPTQLDGILYYLRVLLGKAKSVVVDPAGTLRQLATAMYLGGYYQGRHAGARPYYKRALPLTVPEQANVDDYTKALEGVYAQTIEPNMGPLIQEEKSPMPDPTPAPAPTAFAKRLAEIALAHAPCSAHDRQDVYVDIIVRPSDRTEARLPYYIGNKPPSTCGLLVEGALRLDGLTDPELVDPYKTPPGAVADLQTVAKRHGVLEYGTPTKPPCCGDAIIIDEVLVDKDGKEYDNAHVILCTSDAAVSDDGLTWAYASVQGGQYNPSDKTGGSSAVMSFPTSTLVKKNGRWYAGAGTRYVIAICRFSRLDFPVSQQVPVAKPAEPPEEPTKEPEPAREPAAAPQPNDGAPTGGVKKNVVGLAAGASLFALVAGVVAWVWEKC